MHDNERGVLFVGIGQKYAKQAVRASWKLKQQSDLPVAVVTDVDLEDSKHIDLLIEGECNNINQKLKINNITKTPFKETLFLDTDVYVEKDIKSIYSILDRVDIAVARKPDRYRRYETQRIEGVPSTFPEFNTGVIVFKRNSKVRQLFEKWSRFDEDRFPHDQPSFRKALYLQDNLQYHTLDERWNCRFTVPGSVAEKVYMFHGKPWQKLYNGKRVGLQVWSDEYLRKMKTSTGKINDTDLPRIHMMNKRGHVNVYQSGDYLHRKRSEVEDLSKIDTAITILSEKGITVLLRKVHKYISGKIVRVMK